MSHDQLEDRQLGRSRTNEPSSAGGYAALDQDVEAAL